HVGLFGATVQIVEKAARVAMETWQAASTEPQRPILGIPEGPYLTYAEPEGLAHFSATVVRLEKAGFVIVRMPVMPDFDEIYQRHNAIVAYDAARVHADWFDAYPALYHAKTAELIQRGPTIAQAQYETALQSRLELRQKLTEQMQTHQIDLWLSPPALGPAPRGLDSTGNPVMNLPWTHAGLPTLTLPAGKNSEGLPLGLQLTAGWAQDEMLLAWAKKLETTLG
ncbi:MAG TPA: amidase family protein, partial [Anaerolineales bacterium]|nr:amidase family protein [Anaerolineales bacterium]